jgi:hypothetical protein
MAKEFRSCSSSGVTEWESLQASDSAQSSRFRRDARILSANETWGAERNCMWSVHSVTPVTPASNPVDPCLHVQGRARYQIFGIRGTLWTVSSPDKSKAAGTPMTRIPAKVISVDKQRGQYCVNVRMRRMSYKGAFDTLVFGERRPTAGSSRNGRLQLIYFQDPGLEEGEAFPLWTIQ